MADLKAIADSNELADDMKKTELGKSTGKTDLTLKKLNDNEGGTEPLETTIVDDKTNKSYKVALINIQTSGQNQFTALTVEKNADFTLTVVGDDEVTYEATEKDNAN